MKGFDKQQIKNVSADIENLIETIGTEHIVVGFDGRCKKTFKSKGFQTGTSFSLEQALQILETSVRAETVKFIAWK